MSASAEGERDEGFGDRGGPPAVPPRVRQPGRHGEQFAALFLLGCLLFNYPLMTVFSVDGRVLGVPILFAYLFSAWAGLIALVALVAEKRRP